MMKQFIAFVNKEFRHILRDRRSMLIILGIPVVQILLFGFAINTEVQDLRVAVFAPSPNEITKGITERIHQSTYFTLQKGLSDPKTMEEWMRRGKLDVMVVFDTDGEAVQLIINSSDPNRGSIANTYATAIISEYMMEQAAQSGERFRMPFQIDVDNRLIYNPEMESAYMFVPGIMGLVLMLICTMMTSASIVREKERGTMEVLLASPLKQGTMVFAKTIPYLALSLVNFVSILLLSYYVLEVPIRGSLWTLTLISVLYIFLSLAFGLLISTLVRNQINAVIISAVSVILPCLLLSGMIFPIKNMPQILQWLSYIVPTRWYIDIVRKVMIQGLGWAVIWKETVILVGMSLLLVGSSILNIKSRLE